MFFRFWSPLAFIPFLACCLMEVRLLWEVWLSMSAWAEMILDPWSRVHFVGIFLPFCCSVLKSEFGLFCYFYYIYFRPVIKFIILFWSVFFFLSEPRSISYSYSEFFEIPIFSNYSLEFLDAKTSPFYGLKLFLNMPSYFVYKFEKSDVVTWP